jgi:hypothetical protein
MASEPVSIFFSYSRKDEALMRELESHLEPLRLSRLIESWHDGCITPGEEWEPQIKANLQKAQIILLLISVNFISSKYCNTVELTEAIKRHKSGNACVIPLILKPCMWQPIPVGGITLGELQALPKNAHPVTLWSDRDEAYTNIAEGLYEKILRLQQEREAEAERQRQKAEAAHRRQQEREEVERKRRKEAELQQHRERYYKDGIYHLGQGEYERAFVNFKQAEQLGHPEATKMLIENEKQKEIAEDGLWSEKGIDYFPLRDSLRAREWESADQETYKVMIHALNKQMGEWFTADDLLNFPCTDLLTIDRLWTKYSQNHFGLSVQKNIYINSGAELNGQYPGDKVWNDFGKRVGWKVRNQWISYARLEFSKSAPRGHLPGGGTVWGVGIVNCVMGQGWAIYSRINDCQVKS